MATPSRGHGTQVSLYVLASAAGYRLGGMPTALRRHGRVSGPGTEKSNTGQQLTVRRPRRILTYLVGLPLLLGLLAAVLALCGLARWGHASWYFHAAADYRLHYGQQELRAGNLDRVEQIAANLQDDGYLDQAALLRGEALFRQGKALVESGQPQPAVGRLADAVREFNKIHDQGEIRIEAAALSGQCLLYLKQPREAERALRFVLHERPDHVDAHRALAAIYFDQGALMAAVQHLKRVAELDDADGRPHRLMGLIYKDLEDYGTAIDCYRRALGRELRGQSPDKVQMELAECLSKQNGWAEALALLVQCDPSPEDAPTVAALRAECLRGLGRVTEAGAVLDQALAAFPDDVVLLRQRAIVHLAAKEPMAAVRLLQQALDLDRHDYTSLYQLGLGYRMLGRATEAEQQLRLAEQTKEDLLEHRRLTQEAAAQPWDGRVRLRLAALCDKLGRPSDAAQWRQAAAACSPPPARANGEGSKPTDQE